MRINSAELDAEVAGSALDDRFIVRVWRGGQIQVAELPVTALSIDWDVARKVQGHVTVTVVSSDGSLAPTHLGAPLAPGGSRLEIAWQSGLSSTRIDLGMWRIRKVDVAERWVIDDGKVTSGGATITVQADEETATADLWLLDGDYSPAAGTVLSEVARLMSGVLPVVTGHAYVDGPCPQVTYGSARLAAVDDLLASVGASRRVTGRALELCPAKPLSPVLTVQGGEGGLLVDVSRSLSDESLANAIIGRSTNPWGEQLVARATRTTGALAWDGPFGRVPLLLDGVSSTQAALLAEANTALSTAAAEPSIDLPVKCVAHPGLQVFDLIRVSFPTRPQPVLVDGVVSKIGWGTVGDPPTPRKTMDITLTGPQTLAGTPLTPLGGMVS